MPYLSVKLGPDTLLIKFLGRIDLVFGRLPKSDVQLRDMKVSRLHCQIFIDSRGQAFVRDLGSAAGTSVNGKRLAEGTYGLLLDGMLVRIGDARVTFFDRVPPDDAVDGLAVSKPRGLVRTNERDRKLGAEPTMPAGGARPEVPEGVPTEAPPEVRPTDFNAPGDRERSATEKQGKGKKNTGRVTGIVEAPWERTSTGSKSTSKGRLLTQEGTLQSPITPRPSRVMPSANMDKEGNFILQDAPPPTDPDLPLLPPEAAFDSDPHDTEVPPPSSALSKEAYQPPPLTSTGKMAVDEEVNISPVDRKVKMPTVRIDREAAYKRMRELEEQEENHLPVIPYANNLGPVPLPIKDEGEDQQYDSSMVIEEEEEDISDVFIDDVDEGQQHATSPGDFEDQPAPAPFSHAAAEHDPSDDSEPDETSGPSRIDEHPERVLASDERSDTGSFKPRKSRRVISRRTGNVESEPAELTPDEPALDDLGDGPGGETVAIPSQRLRQELQHLDPEDDQA
jgi:pSer/pThr/pTyr-binding forkhead associated (FHA) protein